LTTIAMSTIAEQLNTMSMDIDAMIAEAFGTDSDRAKLKPRKRGDDSSMITATYKKHWAKHYHTAWNIVKCSDTARDVCHDAYAKAHSKREQFQGHSAMSTYIFRIVVNQALDLIKSGSYKMSVHGGAKDSGDVKTERAWTSHDVVPRPFTCPERALLNKERMLHVQHGLNKMKPAKSDALWGHVVDGKSMKQLAKETGKPLGTVLSRINAARSELRAIEV